MKVSEPINSAEVSECVRVHNKSAWLNNLKGALLQKPSCMKNIFLQPPDLEACHLHAAITVETSCLEILLIQ